MNDIVVISPELNGGVGDYTHRLLEHLPSVQGLRVVVPEKENRPPRFFERYQVEETTSRWRDLSDRLPGSGGKVLLQYSAYGYQAFGYPRWLIKGLSRWKYRSKGKLVIMFHEIWARWPIWNPNYFVQRLHRQDLGSLLRVTDFVFTSTADQADQLRNLWRGCVVQVLPVGSNIRRMAVNAEEREQGLVVLFGLQPGRVRALQKMESELRTLAASGRIQKIVTVGGGRSPQGDNNEHALLLKMELADGFEQQGPLPEDKISELLSTAEFAVSIQDELGVTKSSTLMAYAAHGLNIISPYADIAKPEPLSLMISPNELLNGISEADLRSRGVRLRGWQERTSPWPGIAGQIAQALGI